jgi:hypothetical protein
MKATHQIGRAGVGTAIGAVIFGALLASSCAPGKLPCEKDDEWRAVCDTDGTGQGGGGGGGMGGAPGMGGAAGGVTPATAVVGCDAFKTVGEMDTFFAMRCSPEGGPLCHPTGMSAWQDMKSPEIWKRLANKPANYACREAKLIDTETWENGVIWRKVKAPVMCPPGAAASAMPFNVMPDKTMAPMPDALRADELACLEGYLKAIAAAM